jgi:hypothetical protein
MKNRIAIRWAQNPLLAALLLAAFFSRALIPAGFMPGPGGLVLCNGFGPAPTTVSQAMSHDMSTMDMSGMDMAGMDMPGMAHAGGHPAHGGGSQDHEGSSLCPFAAAATTMASSHASLLSVTVAVDSRPVLLPEQPFVPRGTIASTSLPRGPPLVLA